MSTLSLPTGLLTGSALQDLFAFCKQERCALPAVNVVSSNSVNAVLLAAKEAKSPVIVQFSHGGGHFFGGKWLSKENHEGPIAGAVAGAHYVREMARAYGVPVILHTDHAARKLLPWIDGLLAAGKEHYKATKKPLFSSHMLDLSEEPLEENLATCKTYLEQMASLDMTLEIELGVTGGEEDGVDNSHVDNAKLYTQPSEVLAAYDLLSPVGAFTVAASFGNTHGVYKPGNVELRPEILKNSQETIAKERGTKAQPVDFVFHGGSGSTPEEISEAVSYGVIKMNIDTDTQWAFCKPVKAYMDEKSAYLQSQLGNPEGPDAPNKKHIDPRVWLQKGERGMADRVVQAFKDLNSFEKFKF